MPSKETSVKRVFLSELTVAMLSVSWTEEAVLGRAKSSPTCPASEALEVPCQ